MNEPFPAPPSLSSEYETYTDTRPSCGQAPQDRDLVSASASPGCICNTRKSNNPRLALLSQVYYCPYEKLRGEGQLWLTWLFHVLPLSAIPSCAPTRPTAHTAHPRFSVPRRAAWKRCATAGHRS